nr:hypothetical protein [Pseudomonas syringae]
MPRTSVLNAVVRFTLGKAQGTVLQTAASSAVSNAQAEKPCGDTAWKDRLASDALVHGSHRRSIQRL